GQVAPGGDLLGGGSPGKQQMPGAEKGLLGIADPLVPKGNGEPELTGLEIHQGGSEAVFQLQPQIGVFVAAQKDLVPLLVGILIAEGRYPLGLCRSQHFAAAADNDFDFHGKFSPFYLVVSISGALCPRLSP